VAAHRAITAMAAQAAEAARALRAVAVATEEAAARAVATEALERYQPPRSEGRYRPHRRWVARERPPRQPLGAGRTRSIFDLSGSHAATVLPSFVTRT
jgi:hypothetical protein